MSDFDVIVVGSGAAGGPLATRLAEDRTRRVLLIEAGAAPISQEEYPADLLNPGLMTGCMPSHPQNWAFPANLTPERPWVIARGKYLGGSTVLNGTYFVRARRDDFDRYEELGNDEWSYEKVLPFYEKLETDTTFGDREGHGAAGPIPVTRATSDQITPYTKAFIAACLEAGFAWEDDKNGQGERGVGLLPMNAVDGIRMSTGITYINPARDRSNFEVWGDTLARRVLFDDLTVTGLEVSRNGEVQTVTAPEIVISAGAINSPHLLALSGIGPRTELETAGIPMLVDLPGVGKQFSDHPVVPFNWTPKERLDPEDLRFGFQTALHFNSQDSTVDGDLELMPMMRPNMTMLGFERAGNDLVIAAALMQAKSRGNITTVSSDPAVMPTIEYNYLDNENDLRLLREAVRLVAALLHTEAFAAHFDGYTDCDDEILADDESLNAYIRSHLDTGIHAAGSCAMGDDTASGHVVDQYGRVHGVSGLRVADTSILPLCPSRGPSATATLIGERIAAFMIEQSVTAPAQEVHA